MAEFFTKSAPCQVHLITAVLGDAHRIHRVIVSTYLNVGLRDLEPITTTLET
jgi:hypothetical protein